MRAAVVGVNWGRVHVAALREAGAQVVAVVARERDNAERAAQELGVPAAFDDPAALHHLDLDVISVATPAATHREVIAALPDIPVICEKPAVGASPARSLPRRRAPVWVNYAFARLDTAALAGQSLTGPVRSARVVSAHDLPHLTDEEAFYELVTHPWSWLVALLGPPTVEGAELRCGGVPVELRVERRPGLTGIRHEVQVADTRGTVSVTGSYRVGGDWVFEAHREAPLGEPETGPPDPWYTANAHSIAAAVRGGADRWLFDWERALAMDRCAQQLRARR